MRDHAATSRISSTSIVRQRLERLAPLLGGRLGGRAAVRLVHAHREEVGPAGADRGGHVDVPLLERPHPIGVDELRPVGEHERGLVAARVA